jgi:hypothetical protein
MTYDRENQKVIYKSKHGTIIYEPLDWLAAITSHIPNKYSQSVHFYGPTQTNQEDPTHIFTLLVRLNLSSEEPLLTFSEYFPLSSDSPSLANYYPFHLMLNSF